MDGSLVHNKEHQADISLCSTSCCTFELSCAPILPSSKEPWYSSSSSCNIIQASVLPKEYKCSIERMEKTYAENGSNFLERQPPGIWECEPDHRSCQRARYDEAEIELPADSPMPYVLGIDGTASFPLTCHRLTRTQLALPATR